MRAVNHNARITSAVLLALLLGAYLFSNEANAEGNGRDISRINGRIFVESGEPVGDVSTINGRINVAAGATAYTVSTVNGGISLERDTTVEDAETVNGDIRVDSGARVDGSLTTVNGGIRIQDDVQIGGSVRAVNGSVRIGARTEIADSVHTSNGDIRLSGSRVHRDVKTANGDISLTDSTEVDGDIEFREKRRWWNRFWTFGERREPRLIIDSSSVVRGDIHLFREVELDIASEARVGEIIRHY